MKPTEYHCPTSCNKCGKPTITIGKQEGEHEFETKCDSCGHEDYWAYGFICLVKTD